MQADPETENHGAPDPGRDGRGEAGGEGLIPEVAGNAEFPQPEDDGTGVVGEPEIPEVTPAGSEGGGEVDPQHPGGDGNSAHKPAGRSRISRKGFRAACIAGEGNRSNISRAIGCSWGTVDRRIREDPELNEMYGDVHGDPPSDAPDSLAVMNRSREDIPDHVAVEVGHVDAEDLTIYRNALRAYGVSERRLQKIKALDGLAKDWATHMSISLRGHHQSYDAQLHDLAELADDITERMKGTLMRDGSIQPLDAESYSYLAKIKVECVKEGGKGVGVMLALTEALVRMLAANKDKGAGPKAESGWGPMKKVRKVEGGA